jgi:hypothetical protein
VVEYFATFDFCHEFLGFFLQACEDGGGAILFATTEDGYVEGTAFWE